jgi:alpha-galactosidase
LEYRLLDNMPAVKIVIIGAGSASFGINTIASILRSQSLSGSSLMLVDLDEQALTEIERLANRVNHTWSTNMTIQANTERRKLLKGAHFVIVSVEVPPRESLWRLDWEIPQRHGLRQPYAENGGPGGLMHACRQIPPFMDIVRDIEDLCPDAWLINFSNPLPRITRAVSKYSQIKIVGKCHQLDVGYGLAATILANKFGFDIPEKLDFHSDPVNTRNIQHMARLGRTRLNITAAGLNHFTWILDIRDKETGEDLYPKLRILRGDVASNLEPLSMELFDIFGLCPAVGDGHLCEYLAWTHDPQTNPWEKYNLRLYDWEASQESRNGVQASIRSMSQGQSSVEWLRNSTSEGAVELIESISTDNRFYDEAVNIPNEGAIQNLPSDAIVEIPASVSGLGIRGLNLPPLPDAIAELCRREAFLVELVVDAAVTGNSDLLFQALLLDPMMNDIDRAKAILDDYLTTFANFLPQFSKKS